MLCTTAFLLFCLRMLSCCLGVIQSAFPALLSKRRFKNGIYARWTHTQISNGVPSGPFMGTSQLRRRYIISSFLTGPPHKQALLSCCTLFLSESFIPEEAQCPYPHRQQWLWCSGTSHASQKKRTPECHTQYYLQMVQFTKKYKIPRTINTNVRTLLYE